MGVEEHYALLELLVNTPDEVQGLVEGLPSDRVKIRPDLEEFSVLETVCHLRDIEAEGYGVRIQRIIAEDRPFLPDLDGARLAIERDYNRQNLAAALADFSQARQKNVELLKNASASQFDREGELEGVGVIKLGKLLAMMCEHDSGHVDELRIARARCLKATGA
jgi:hypothetical protein